MKPPTNGLRVAAPRAFGRASLILALACCAPAPAAAAGPAAAAEGDGARRTIVNPGNMQTGRFESPGPGGVGRFENEVTITATSYKNHSRFIRNDGTVTSDLTVEFAIDGVPERTGNVPTPLTITGRMYGAKIPESASGYGGFQVNNAVDGTRPSFATIFRVGVTPQNPMASQSKEWRAQPGDIFRFDVGGMTIAEYRYPAGAPSAPAPEAASDSLQMLQDAFAAMVSARIAQGYYVKNDGWLRGLKNMIQDRGPSADWTRGGRCGQYGEEWGPPWSSDFVRRIYGDGAIVDYLFIEEASTTDGSAWDPDRLYEANHCSTRVTLPDGRRFMMDYWEAISTGNAVLQPERDWIRNWHGKISGLLGYDAAVRRSAFEQELKNSIAFRGEERGIEVFRIQNRPGITVGANTFMPPAKLETVINSWRREPW